MALRAVIVFLIKIFPLFFLILLAWQYLKLSHVYHYIIAAVMNVVYPSLDPTGLVTGLQAEGGTFIAEMFEKGKSFRFKIIGEDITSNTAMLYSLYLASPFRRHFRRFAVFFLASLFILFLVHCLTVATTILYACISNPEIMQRHPIGLFTIKTVDTYIYFYELIGMYLIILALWFPYIITCVSESRYRKDVDKSS